MIRYLNLESHLPLIIALGMFGAHKTMQHVTETERHRGGKSRLCAWLVPLVLTTTSGGDQSPVEKKKFISIIKLLISIQL